MPLPLRPNAPASVFIRKLRSAKNFLNEDGGRGIGPEALTRASRLVWLEAELRAKELGEREEEVTGAHGGNG